MKKTEFLARLSTRFIKKTPLHATLVVVFSLLSQLGMMFASLLPLKVLILLGSEGVPGYFPDLMVSLDKNTLVVSLGVLAVFFFVVHVVSEWLVERFSQRGVRQLVSDNKKTLIYNQQRKVAEAAYRKSTSSIAGFLFIALVVVYVFWFNAVVGVSVALLTTVVFGVALKVSAPKIQNGAGGLYAILPHAKLLSVLCFLGGFVSIVATLLVFGVNSFLFTLVCLLLLRQGFNRLPKLISDMCWIDSKKSRIQALFYKAHVFDSAQEKLDTSVWRYIEGLDFKNTVADVVGIDKNQEMGLHLLKEGGGSIFEFKADFSVDGEYKSVLVKKFSSGKSAPAYHEKIVFRHDLDNACSPRFIGMREHNGYYLNFFDITGLSLSQSSGLSKNLSLYTRMASQTPISSLVDVYCKSSPVLWKRLTHSNFKRVAFVESLMKEVDFRFHVAYLDENSKRLIGIIKKMPVFMLGGNVRNPLIWQGGGVISTTSWESWAIEPIGSGWPISNKHVDDQEVSLNKVVSEREDCAFVTFDMYRLVSLSYYFDIYCRRKEYMQAVMLAPEMRQRLESIIERGSE